MAQNKSLINNAEYLNKAIDFIGEAVVFINDKNEITLFNKAAERLTGLDSSKVLKSNVNKVIQFLDDEKNPINYLNGESYSNRNVMLYRQDGMFWNVSINIQSFFSENQAFLGRVLTIYDQSDIKRREKEILYLSYHDALTGLYNRTYLDEAIQRLDTTKQLPFSVIMGDVNGLKIINDAFGHDTGDNLLQIASRLLKQSCRPEDIIGRWGGDEFVILLPKTPEDEAVVIMNRIIRLFENVDPLHYVKDILPSVSLGYGTKKDSSQNIFESLRVAETNMYRRKMLSKETMYNSIIHSMQEVLNEYTPENVEHFDNLINLSKKISSHYNLNEEDLKDLQLLCKLHDIGEIGVSKEIFNANKSMSSEGWGELKKHPEIGYRIAQSTPHLKKVATYILYHHENYDGSGYPHKLKSTEIPFLDRIFRVIDSFDAMTTYRNYKRKLSKKEACEELLRYSGSLYDPEIVNHFVKSM